MALVTADSIEVTADQTCWTADGSNACIGHFSVGGGGVPGGPSADILRAKHAKFASRLNTVFAPRKRSKYTERLSKLRTRINNTKRRKR